MNHHPVFSVFPIADEGTDFIGARFRPDFLEPHGGKLPPVDNEYFEWIDLLESVAGANGRYVMVELGAGYGRWAVRAACAARSRGVPFHIVAVEPEPQHFEWLKETLLENGVGSNQYTTVNAAVSVDRSAAQLYVGGHGHDAATWYGQRLAWDAASIEDGQYCGRQASVHPSGYKSVTVETVTLSDLLAPFPLVDLIDMDIQGEEYAVIRSAWEVLNRKVKRMHVGTHSREVETSIRRLLLAEGWTCRADYAGCAEHHTPWGRVEFEDGVQSWRNPRLQ